jgi:WD40 repeat protein/energy-coupling factor transporter ATP-binding protein EcfA2
LLTHGNTANMSKLLNNPFPGLRPFQKDESHLFFGRENHVNEIMRKLETFRFVSIVGNSGSGKSSLVRAGILPKIEKSEASSWLICIMRPGKNPVEELCSSLFSTALFGDKELSIRNNQIKENLDILNKSRLGLVQVVRNQMTMGKKLLILADQFEEIFRFNKISIEQNDSHSANNFVDLLLGAVGQKEVPIYVIMTIRSDFLGDCEQFSGLPEAINDGQFLIPRMNREELQTSITGPIDLVNGKISPQLVYQLLNEVGNSPDQLPVLQHVLMRTWEVWEQENNPNKPIDIETYNKTGGMVKALSNHAEEAFAELKTGSKKKLAESIFKTITLKGADNRGIRRPTAIHKIVKITGSTLEEVIEIADVFRRSDRGFIMPPEAIELNENSVLDISHESLMRVWERLGTWVNEEADSAEIYQRICESALLYDKNMAGLWRDPDLQIAVDWHAKNAPNEIWAGQYNDHFHLAIRFIDASKQDKQFLKAESNRRRILTRVIIAAFLIALSSLTLWAYFERNQSDINEKLALTEKQKAEQQGALAKEQKLVAEENALKAEKEKANAELAKQTAEEQRKIAVTNAMEADLQKLMAERASLSANEARKAAELDKQIAQKQRQLSDSLKSIAFQSEKNAYRLRILSIAQTLAIKSSQAKKGTYDDVIKPLLALQANNFNKAYYGKIFDPDIFTALFSASRFTQNTNEHTHNYHTDVVRAVCFSPDGKTVASTGSDGRLILANIGKFQSETKNFSPQPFLIENLTFNQEGNKLAASTDLKSVLIYDISTNSSKPKQIQSIHKDKISSLIWFKDQIITSSFDMTVKFTDDKSYKVVKTLSLPSKPQCMSLCESLNLLITACENGDIYTFDILKGTEFKLLKKIPNTSISSIDCNHDGSRIACGTHEGKIIIILRANPEKNTVPIVAHKSSVTNVKFHPISNFLASASFDQTIKLWNLDIADEQPVIFDEHDNWIYSIAFSRNGERLVSGGRDKTVRTFVVNQELLVKEIEAKVNRNFSNSEWNYFIGTDIPYEKTLH